jgi:hypothetical protein
MKPYANTTHPRSIHFSRHSLSVFNISSVYSNSLFEE